MATYKEIILKNINSFFNLSEEQYRDLPDIYTFSQIPGLSFPLVVFVEKREYSVCDNQNSIDLKNEIKTNVNVTVSVFTNNIDELAQFEEILKSNYSSPQNLSINGERTVSLSKLFCDSTQMIQRLAFKEHGVYGTCVPMIATNIILPKNIVSPVKIELDKDIQLNVMKHLSLLDDYSALVEQEIENILNSDSLRGFSSRDEKIANLSFDTKLKYDYYYRLYSEVEQQVADMYTFEELCQEKIQLSDHGFKMCYQTMLEENCDIKTATAKYKEKREKELKLERRRQNEILKWEKVFNTKGDEALNFYADAVVRDITSKLNVNYPVSVYGGSSSMEYFRLNEKEMLDFPNIFVFIASNYSLQRTNYVNLNSQGAPVVYDYSCEALPINLGFMLFVMADEKQQVEEIKAQLNSMYSNEVTVTVPDPVLNGNMRAVRLAFKANDDITKFTYFEKIKSKNQLYHSIVVLNSFPSVYYTQCCIQSDIEYNERLQYSLLQRINFLMLCDSWLRGECIRNLDFYYQSLFTPSNGSILGSFFAPANKIKDSDEYKKLKLAIRNKQPVDRDFFNKVLLCITCKYPPLYDRMIQGWSVEQIREDMIKYADYFNKEWNTLLKDLADKACPEMYSQLNISRGGLDQSLERIHSIIVYYIREMATDFYCTLKDVVGKYSIFSSIKLTPRVEPQEQQPQQQQVQYIDNNNSGGYSGGGFLKDIAGIALGVAVGNKLSQPRKNRDGTVDLWGTAACPYGLKANLFDRNAPDFMTISCNISCPKWRQCKHR